MTGTLAYALAAARRGWHVFPLRSRLKTPLGGFTDWERHATTNTGRITAFWSRGPYNVAIACGPSRLVVIDLDMPKPDETPPEAWNMLGVNEGADVFAVLCERHHQPYPYDTFTVRTRQGGTHLYFTAPAGLELRNTSGRHRGGLGWLIDTRAAGGYVVGPGSRVDLPDGSGTYDVVNDAPPASLPIWLGSLLDRAPEPPPSLGACSADVAGVADLDAYAQAALNAEAARITSAQTGGRNWALNKAAYNLGRLIGARVLPEAVARDVLWNAVSVHINPGRDGFTEREAAATINAALSAGVQRPRDIIRREKAA